MNVADVIDLTMVAYAIHILIYAAYTASLCNTVTLFKS